MCVAPLCNYVSCCVYARVHTYGFLYITTNKFPLHIDISSVALPQPVGTAVRSNDEYEVGGGTASHCACGDDDDEIWGENKGKN